MNECFPIDVVGVLCQVILSQDNVTYLTGSISFSSNMWLLLLGYMVPRPLKNSSLYLLIINRKISSIQTLNGNISFHPNFIWSINNRASSFGKIVNMSCLYCYSLSWPDPLLLNLFTNPCLACQTSLMLLTVPTVDKLSPI